MEEVKAWKPVCCNKAYIIKANAKRHELTCPWNPKNRACATCGCNSSESETVYMTPRNGNYGDDDYDRQYYWCSYFEKEISKSEVVGKTIFPQSHCNYWTPKGENDDGTDKPE